MPIPAIPPGLQSPAALLQRLPAGSVEGGGTPCVRLVNSFDEGTSGTALTTGNTASATDNAADTISAGAGTTLAFDSTHAAHRTLGCQVVNTTTNAATFGWSTQLGTCQTAWFRVYLYFTGNPGATARVFRAAQGATLCGAMAISTTGKILMLNAAGATVLTSATTIPLNTFFRVEGYITGDSGNGVLSFSLFTGNIDAPVGSPTETQTSTGTQNTFGVINTVTYGVTATTPAVGPFWMDDIGAATCGYVGPALLAVAVPPPLQMPQTAVSRHGPARAVTGARGASGAGVAGTVRAPAAPPVQVVPIPRKPPARAVFRGIPAAAVQPQVLPRPPPTAIARKGPARAVWRGTITRTVNAVFVAATPAPKRLPPQPRKPPAPVTWRGTVVRTVNATPGTVPVTALQRPPTIPRKPPSRAVTRGLAAPFRIAQPVTGGIVRRLGPARAVWRRIVAAAQQAVPVTGGSVTKRQGGRVTWRGLAVRPVVTAPPAPGDVDITDQYANRALISDTAVGSAVVTDSYAATVTIKDTAPAATITDQPVGTVTIGDLLP